MLSMATLRGIRARADFEAPSWTARATRKRETKAPTASPAPGISPRMGSKPKDRPPTGIARSMGHSILSSQGSRLGGRFTIGGRLRVIGMMA